MSNDIILMVGRFEVREQYTCLTNDTHETFLMFNDAEPLLDAAINPDYSGQPVGVRGAVAEGGVLVEKMYRLGKN